MASFLIFQVPKRNNLATKIVDMATSVFWLFRSFTAKK